MYHMTGFYSFPHPISQILDIAPRFGAIPNSIAPKLEYMWFLVPRYTSGFLVKKSRPGYRPPKWYIYIYIWSNQFLYGFYSFQQIMDLPSLLLR